MFEKKIIKYISLATVSFAVLGSSSCGATKEELIARAVQGSIGAAVAYLTPVSLEQEKQIGVQSQAQVFTQYKEYTGNQDLTNYVKSVASKVIDQASRKSELNYQVYIIDTPEINAFTIAGGSIFITTEILKYLNNEAELSGIIAHEVGHNERKHPVSTIKRALALQGLAQGALSQNDPAVIQLLANASLSLILNGFSRKQETEADETGTLIISKLNYQNDALATFLKTLITVSPDPNGLIKLFQTHPGSQDRINDINQYIGRNNFIKSNFTNTDVYKKHVSVLPAKAQIK